MLDARLLERDLAHAADHFLGAVQRRAVGQLREADQVLLVLRRHEAVRHQLEQADGRRCQDEVDAQHQRLARHRAGEAARVAGRGAPEQAVETAEEAAEHAVHAARQRVLRRVVALEQQRSERRRQRERVDGRDHGRDRDGQRELAVELARQPADEGQRHEHRHQHQRDRDDRPRYFAHGPIGGVARRQPRLDVALDVLHHDDGVVHHDADRQHQAEQAERVDREAEQVHHREGADDRDRHRQQRDDGGAPGLQEQDHDQHHQRDRLQQRVHHRLDRGAHELRRVVDDLVIDAFGHRLLQLRHGLAHAVGDLDRVGARRLEDRHGDRVLVVQQRAQRVVRGAQLQPRDVAQPRHRAVGAALDDDVAELVLALQPALRVDRQLQVDALDAGRRADHAGRGLDVLLADRAHHVARGEAALRDLLRVEPDAHRIVARAEQLHVADALRRAPAGP